MTNKIILRHQIFFEESTESIIFYHIKSITFKCCLFKIFYYFMFCIEIQDINMSFLFFKTSLFSFINFEKVLIKKQIFNSLKNEHVSIEKCFDCWLNIK